MKLRPSNPGTSNKPPLHHNVSLVQIRLFSIDWGPRLKLIVRAGAGMDNVDETYAQSKGIPTFIHESNAFAGKSNIWLGKNATKIFTGTNGMETDLKTVNNLSKTGKA